MHRFGLIGKNIGYSFSRNYFQHKFNRLAISAQYENFDLDDLSTFPQVLKQNPDLVGLNVTIPYKQAVIPYLDELDQVAAEIGAVNTIKIVPGGRMIGFNTDHNGFSGALIPNLEDHHQKALVLGTGGASKAVVYALDALDIKVQLVSRKSTSTAISYQQLNETVMDEHHIIVNCTPIGTAPQTTASPPIPVDLLSSRHLVFDLIYNPEVTRLMELSSARGAKVLNGYRMLELQAEKAWEIWNTPPLATGTFPYK